LTDCAAVHYDVSIGRESAWFRPDRAKWSVSQLTVGWVERSEAHQIGSVGLAALDPPYGKAAPQAQSRL